MNENLDEKVLTNWQRSSREVFEHEPRELFFSVNGDVKAVRIIEKKLTELRLEFAQQPEFIEIFSEQDVCLAFLSFVEDSTSFEAEQRFKFDFSDERTLLLDLKKKSSQIILEAVFEDPHFEERAGLSESVTENKSLTEFLREFENPVQHQPEIFGNLLGSRAKSENSLIEKIKNSFLPSFVGFKTAMAGGSLAVLVITALLFTKFFVFVPNLSAREIIQKAANVEQSSENDAERVVYRVLNFEEKNAAGETVNKQKIEIFSDAAGKLSVRRLFDENNRLIAGEWRRPDGVSTIYSVGKMSELQLYKTDKEIIHNDLENIWQMSVSAKGFESIIGSPEDATVEEENNQYRINYQPASETGLTKAVLHINQELRANKLILTVNRANSNREFYFTEAVFEKKNRETVENTAFEPNVELVKNATITGKNNSLAETDGNPADESETAEISKTEASSNSVTSEMEVKVLQLLNNVNALSGDQINIVKTPDGKLQIRGIVDAKSRKDEILNALTELRGNPAISVTILTAEEASKNKPSIDKNATLESISVESKNSIPAGDILRKHFSAQGVAEEKIEAEIRRFASNALSKSSQVRRSALQLKQIAGRFSAPELEKMDEVTRNNWRRLIKQNAATLAQNSENLRSDFRDALNINAENSGGNINSASDGELIKTANRLFDLALSLDRDVSASFRNSGGNRTNVPVKSAKFASTLAEIIGLARQLK